MNWLDVILGALFLIATIGGLVISVICFKDCDGETGFFMLVLTTIAGFLLGSAFVVVDKGSGSTIGEITSVDKNYFGTTALFVKTSETFQEEYCIEDSDVATQAAELIGKKVKISYSERVGIYSTGACSQAPVEKIEIIEGVE